MFVVRTYNVICSPGLIACPAISSNFKPSSSEFVPIMLKTTTNSLYYVFRQLPLLHIVRHILCINVRPPFLPPPPSFLIGSMELVGYLIAQPLTSKQKGYFVCQCRQSTINRNILTHIVSCIRTMPAKPIVLSPKILSS